MSKKEKRVKRQEERSRAGSMCAQKLLLALLYLSLPISLSHALCVCCAINVVFAVACAFVDPNQHVERARETERGTIGRQEAATQLAKQMQIKWRDTKQAATCK